MLDDEMLTIEDLAGYLKLKPQTIYKWAQTGKIPGAKFGKEWRFRRSQIEEWINDRMAQAGSKSKDGADKPRQVADGASEDSRTKDAARAKKAGGRNSGSSADYN